MQTDTDGFINAAKGLAKNPLGIIALFIALIYGFATLLFGVAAGKLNESEKSPLIWFIVLFPVLVLAVFYRLVTNHHGKLYAPADYKDDKSFLNTLPSITPQEATLRDTRIDEEVETIVETTPSTTDTLRVPIPESTASNSSAIERSNIRSEYVEAERLALRKLSNELKTKIHEGVTIEGDKTTAFDGLAAQGKKITFIEVKLLRRPVFQRTIVREVLYRAVIAMEKLRKNGPELTFELVIAVVMADTSSDYSAKVEDMFKEWVRDAPISVTVRLFVLDDLRREFPDSVLS